MRGPIRAHDPRAVQRKHHGQVLQGHVVDELVIAALQEGGVDGHHRLEALAGQAACEGHGVLLGDTHIVAALREALLKLHHARALEHGRRDAHQARVGRGHVAQPVAKHLGEGGLGRCGRLLDALCGIEGRGAVVLDGVGFCELVAVALLRDHVQELRPLHLAHVLQRGNQGVEVVAIDRAYVVEAEFLEDGRGGHHALGVFFKAARQFEQGRRIAQHALGRFARGRIKLAAHQPRQVLVERAHGWADRHVVVVEHHQQVGGDTAMRHTPVVQGLKGHARTHGAVADDGHGFAVFTLELRAQGHAQRRRNRGGGVRGTEGVVLAFVAARKSRQAAQLAQGVEALAPAGEDLVRIGLVAHVPHQTVFWRVVDGMQGDGELHRAQVAREVAAGFAHRLQQELAQLTRQGLQLQPCQPTQVGRAVDRFQQGEGGHGHGGSSGSFGCAVNADGAPPGLRVHAAVGYREGRCLPGPQAPARAVRGRVPGRPEGPSATHKWV